jgi:hypothetical protein
MHTSSALVAALAAGSTLAGPSAARAGEASILWSRP